MTPTPDTPEPAPNDAVLAAAIKPGDTLGAYRIDQRLSASEVYVTWSATDTGSGRAVLVRQLIPGSPVAREPAFVNRCRAEVKKQQALKDKVRRVVFLDDLIEDARGTFVVTDHVQGASVEALLCSRPDAFDMFRALRIIYAVARTLSQLHKHGLVHGGLRTTSLIVNANASVHLCEAGLSSLIAEQEALDPEAARYMAPELFRAEAPDAQSDIYSLGMIAYEIFAGRGAFNQVFASVLGDQRGAAMRWMKWHTNPRALATPLHELNPKTPEKLSELVARMMAKERNRRIATADQLVEAIHRNFGRDAVAKAEAADQPTDAPPTTSPTTGPGDTAKLPPRSSRPKILAITAVILILAAGGVWMTVSTIKHNALQQRRSLAEDALRDADRDYKVGRFDQALSIYQQVARDWPDAGDGLGKHGRAGALIAQLQLDLAGDDLAAAHRRLSALEGAADAGPVDRSAVRALSDELDRREQFKQVTDAIQKHLDAGEFAQARIAARDLVGAGLTESESNTLMNLQVRIDARLESEQVGKVLAQADDLAGQDDFAGAIALLTDSAERLHGPRLSSKIKSLELEQSFRGAVARSEAAEGREDYDGAIEALGQALSLRADADLSAHLLVLKAKSAVERGRALAEAGDMTGAAEQFTDALGYDPENTEAKGRLARMNVTIAKQSHVEAGRRAEASGDLAQAAGQYREALKSGPDEEVESALKRVEVALALARADQMIRAEQLDQAGEALDEARQLQPDNPQVEQAQQNLDRHVQYRELVDRGDAFVEQGRYARATQTYVKARDVIDTDEIAKRLNDTEYAHLLAQARGFMAGEQWASARGMLDTAAGIRVTDELTRLRDQVDRELKQIAAEKQAEGDGDE